MAEDNEDIISTNDDTDDSGDNSAAPSLTHPQVFGALLSALGGQESGNNYGAVNGRTGATGKYQITPANIPAWSKEILGRSISVDQFRKNPALQEQIAQGKLAQYYGEAMQKTDDPSTAAQMVMNKWYTGTYFPDDNKRPRPNEPSPLEYRQQIMSRMGQHLQAPQQGIGAQAYSAVRAIPTPEWLAGHPEDAPQDNATPQQSPVQAQTPTQPTQPIPAYLLKMRAGYVAQQQAQKNNPQVQAQDNSPIPLGSNMPFTQMTRAKLASDPDISPSNRMFNYAIHPETPNKVVDAAPTPIAYIAPGITATIPDEGVSMSGLPTQKWRPVPQAEIKDKQKYIDQTAQETAIRTGVPTHTATGTFRPFIGADGTMQAGLSNPDVEDRIQSKQESDIEQQQNAALDAVSKSVPGTGMGAILHLAANSEVVKGLVGTAVEAGNAASLGTVEALAPETYRAIEGETISPNPSIARIQKTVGALGAVPTLIAGGGLVESLAGAGLSRLGLGAMGRGIAETAITLGASAIPKNVIKVATGQESVGEAGSDIGEQAFTGAVLGAGGAVGSKLAEAANAGRIGTALIKAGAGGVAMNIPQMGKGESPDLATFLQGAAFEGIGGWKEFGAKAKDAFVSKTQDAANAMAKEYNLDKEFSKDEVAQAITKNAKVSDDDKVVTAGAMADLYKQAGGSADVADKFITDVKEAAQPAPEPVKAEAEPEKPAPEQTVAEQHSQTLADTPHSLGEYVNEKNLPTEQREIKTGKNKGKSVDGIIDTDLTQDQAEAITNRAAQKATNADGEEGFFIPKKYVKQAETKGNVDESVSGDKTGNDQAAAKISEETPAIEAPAGQVQGGEAKGSDGEIKSASDLSPKLQQAFDLPKDEADAASTIADARAETWAKENGKDKSEWYQSHIADVVKGGTPGEGALYQGKSEDAPAFYSALDKFIENSKQEKFTPEQLKGMLANAPGIKAEEMNWRGLDKFLEGKKSVTKDEIMSHLAENDVRLSSGESDNRYSQYSLPGGDNYQEHIFTMPGNGYESPHYGVADYLAHARTTDRTIDGKKTLFLEEVQSDLHQKGREGGYQNDALLNELYGKHDDLLGYKHQLQREIDSADDNVPRKLTRPDAGFGLRERDESSPEFKKWQDLNKEYGRVSDEANAVGGKIADLKTAPPDAPFKKTWHELVMKKMLDYAARNGYDQVAWTSGDVQNERYDLSKTVKQINYTPETRALTAVDHQGGNVMRETVPPEKLPDYIGKDAARKILEEPTKISDGIHVLRGEDLKVGGSGMKGFYDKMLPDFANKYLKKYGIKTGEVADTNSEAQRLFSEYESRRDELKKSGDAYENASRQEASIRTSVYERNKGNEDFLKDYLHSGDYNAIFRWATPEELSKMDDLGKTQRTESDRMGEIERLRRRAVDFSTDNKLDGSHIIPITFELRSDILSKGQPLFQGEKGSTEFLSDNRAVIRGLQAPDVSTAVHELGHVFRRDLSGDDLKTTEKWAGVKDGEWKTEHEEKFARGFERYLRNGFAPTEKLAGVFEKFKSWLTNIYKKIKGSDIDVRISPEMKDVFDRLLGKEKENAANTGDIKQSSIEQRQGDNGQLQTEGVDRNIPSEVAQESTTAGSSNSPVAETEKPGLTAKSKLRTASETVAWQDAHPDFPLNNSSSMKAVRDYAIQNRIDVNDAQGNKLSLGTLLDRVRDTVDASEGKKPSELSTSGTLQGSFIPGLNEVAAKVGKDAMTFAKEDVAPALGKAADWVRGVKDWAQRGVAAPTMKFIPDEGAINPRDLHNQQFEFDGKNYRVKSEEQEDGSVQNAYYDTSNNRRLVGASDEMKQGLDQAAKQVYAKKVEGSARFGANVQREQSARYEREMGEMARKVDDARKYLDKLGEEGGQQMISDVMHGRELSPELKPIGDQIAKIFRNEGQKTMDIAKAAGKNIEFNLRDDFFSLLWKREPGLKATLDQILKGKAYPGGSKYFLKNKVFDDIQEGLDKGLKPLYPNPIDFVLHYAAESRKLRAQMEVMKNFKDEGLYRFARTPRDKSIPQGWEKVHGTEVMAKTESGVYAHAGDYYAPPGLAHVMKNYYDKGNLVTNPLFKSWKMVNNHLNQLQLSLSGFHVGFIGLQSAIAKGSLGLSEVVNGLHPRTSVFDFNPKMIGKGLKDLATAPLAPLQYPGLFGAFPGKDASLFRAGRKQWFNIGDRSNNMASMLNDYLQSGGTHYSMPSDYRTPGFKSVGQDFKSGNLFKQVRGAVKSIPAVMEFPSKLVLEHYVPAVKHSAAMDLARFEIEKFSQQYGRDMTPAETGESARKVVDSIDNRFGLLNYDNLMWNNSFKNILMATQRSVGWNFGTIRQLVGAGLDTGTAIKRLTYDKIMRNEYAKSPVQFTERMGYAIMLPVMTGLAGAVTQVLYGQGWPQEMKDYFFPRTGGTDDNGNASRISLPSYTSDVLSYMSHPLATLGHKVSPNITIALNLANNADYWDRAIIPQNANIASNEGLQGLGQYALEQLTPFSFTQVGKHLSEGQTVPQALLSGAVGFRPAPSRLNRSDMQQYLSERAQAENKSEPLSRAESKRKEIRNQLEGLYRSGRGKEADALANNPENRQYVTDADIETAMTHATQFKDKIEKGLHFGQNADVIHAYFKLASEKELKDYASVVGDKLASIDDDKLTPSIATKYYQQITEAEKSGRTKYLNQSDLRDFKETLQGAMRANREPVSNWDQATPRAYTAPRMALPK